MDRESTDDLAALRVGRVTAVEGRRIKVAVDKLKNGSHSLYRGAVIRNAAVGGYVKIAKGFADLIAKVDGEFIHENRLAPEGYGRDVDRIARTLQLSLIGYLEDGRFERGVRELPLLDNECFVLTEHEFRAVHSFAQPNVPTFRLGTVATEPTQPVDLEVDAIFASHVGIFGNTGSGKSYTLARLLHELFEQFGSSTAFTTRAQVVLIDFNGEYVNQEPANGDPRSSAVITGDALKQTYQLSTKSPSGDRLPFSAEALSDPVIWQVLLDATERTQSPFITRVLRSERWERLLSTPSQLMGVVADIAVAATRSGDVAIDKQFVTQLLGEVRDALGDAATEDLDNVIEAFSEQLKFHNNTRTFFWTGAPSTVWADNDAWESVIREPIAGLELDFSGIDDIDRIRFKLVLAYYEEIVRGFANREHLSPLLKRLDARVPDIKKVLCLSDQPVTAKPLVVVSLREVNLSMRKVIPMLLCKRLYDDKKRTDVAGERYLNLVIDEAHNILSSQSSRESDAWRDYRLETFEEIVKEGRKFGVFLTIASQRPHDISETIVSQLHNYFLHRLINNLDVHAIERAVAYLDAISFESIPILGTGTCIVAGVSTQVPVVTKVATLPAESEPNSRTMAMAEHWLPSQAS